VTTVAEVIVRRLLEARVPAIFGMPGGGSNLDLIDAAGRAGLPFVLTATETGAALAALAQAEISGRPGACMTTLGPGVASAVNGVACAHLDRAPLLVLTDSHPASADGFEHQRLDHHALVSSVTKWSATVSADNADEVVREAIDRTMSGQPGPVHLDLPSDVAGVDACESARRSPAGISETADDPLSARPDLERLVTRARRPLLLIGLGARHVVDAAAIRGLCATHGVPAMVTYKAKGVVADSDPHFAGVFTNAAIEQSVLEQADLFIGVGLDPVELIPRPWTHAHAVVNCAPWRVDDRHVPFAAQIVGDVPASLQRIRDLLSRADWDLDSIHRSLDEQRQRIGRPGAGLTPARVVQRAAAAAGAARITIDAGAHMFPATILWPVSEPNGMLISNGLSTMGFALPAAIGAALLDRERPVVALTGDGGLLICAGELLTAARERLRVITIVFSDASLSLIAAKQQQRHHAAAGVALGDIAWCALAESLGVAAHLADTERQLDRALADALDHRGPSLIEARVDPRAYADTLRAVRGT
jgi:acetolactate synthase-1/2/3 large subunit